MARKTILQQEQKLTQRLSQSQILFVRMLEMNSLEAEEAVKKEIEDNPALEAKESDAGQPASDDSADSPALLNTLGTTTSRGEMYETSDSSESLLDYLMSQLRQISIEDENVRCAAEYIIGTLDSNGYMTRSPEGIADDLLFKENIEMDISAVRDALDIVRSLDPPGVGATNIRDCMLIQLRQKKRIQKVADAINIVEHHFDALSKKHYHKILSAAKFDEERLQSALNTITSLNPKPGASFGGGSAGIVPDFIVESREGEPFLILNNKIPELGIEASFSQAARLMGKNAARRKNEDAQYINTRVGEAKEFIRIILRRQQTLMDVMSAIVTFQHEYFTTEDESTLRPMALKDIAALTNFDIPTISRATNNKYISTPKGTFPLRYFFSESFSQGGDETASGRKIEDAIRKLVNAEDKHRPMSDEQLSRRLIAMGYDVSRRTVSKYRDRLGIPVARLRKTLNSH